MSGPSMDWQGLIGVAVAMLFGVFAGGVGALNAEIGFSVRVITRDKDDVYAIRWPFFVVLLMCGFAIGAVIVR